MYIPSVTPVINWRNQKRKKGVYPIHLCVYITGQTRRYYPVQVPQKVRLDQWTGNDGCWVKNTNQKGRKGKLEASTIKPYFDKFKVVLTHAAKKEHLLDEKTVEQYLKKSPSVFPRKKKDNIGRLKKSIKESPSDIFPKHSLETML